MFTKLIKFLLGAPRNFFDKESRHNISLVAFLAWVGLGADGISSSCYGPEEAFIALGVHEELAIYLAIATALTVFIISYAYTQVIELFPNGGGGYRVATRLLGKYAGLVSGSALIVDYVLTISISIASSIDAIFSFLPPEFKPIKLFLAVFLIGLLAFLNLRGMKESIKFLLPIFLGFILTHIFIVVHGIIARSYALPVLFTKANYEIQETASIAGWVFIASIFLKAFSMGGGTYTGLEAVSNNVNTLAEPRVKNAKITMFLLAISLAFMAVGIILIYLLWGINKIEGQTLNATAFYMITQNWLIGDIEMSKFIVPVLLMFEAGLLIVAANSGFLAGPNVIANMASDEWMPKSFSSLSNRLVVKNGICFMALAAIATIFITNGSVHILVVLYSINVFITFSLSLLGLTIYWFRSRYKNNQWLKKISISLLGFVVCFGILLVTIYEKFHDGGWITIIITSFFVAVGLFIRNTYTRFRHNLIRKELTFLQDPQANLPQNILIDTVNKKAPTAAIIVDQTFGSGMNCLLQINKLFPNVFENFLFVTVGELNSNILQEEKIWREMRRKTKQIINKYKNYCNAYGKFSKAYIGYDTDTIEKLTQLTDRVVKDYENVIFFGTKFIFEQENSWQQLLFNHTPYIMQRKLHMKGLNMIILPIKI